MTFESLGLAPALLRALSENNYTTPTPIQYEAIPLALAGHDVLGGAQTGTGKTAAFGLPLLHRLSEGKPAASTGPRKPRALILVPTRELAVQVSDSLRTYGRHLRLNVTTIYGGAGMQPQIDAFRRGVDILVACPGRLLDHLERGSAKLDAVELLVLDEADRMLDMGFLPSIKRILGRCDGRRCCSRPRSRRRSSSSRWNSCATRSRCRSPRRTPSPRRSCTAPIRSMARASANC